MPINQVIPTLFCLLIATSAIAGPSTWHQSWWNPATHARLSWIETQEVLALPSTFVLGEEHYNAAVQEAEAEIIRRLSESLPHSEPLLLGWEFLNTENRARVDQAYARFLSGETTVEQCLAELFPGSAAPVEYIPVFQALKKAGARLIPTNLSRAQKTPVTRGGIEAVDPALLPKDFEMGGTLYFDRFVEAMGPHPLPYPVENYFASQSLTDEVMATELLSIPTQGKRMLITGSFHGDYRDGVVHSISRRASQRNILYIKILDASSYTAEELEALFHDSKYGVIADLVYIVNEPIPAKN